jgi:DNA-directed RNA polymerase I subunit RPA2
MTDVECGEVVANNFFLVHSEDVEDKFNLLMLMFHKLMLLVQGKIVGENCDALSTQEALLPGQLYGAVLKEALQGSLVSLKRILMRKDRLGDDITDQLVVERAFHGIKDVDSAMNYFMSTGTIKSKSGLDLMQVTGFTIVADKLNAVRRRNIVIKNDSIYHDRRG